MASHLLLRTAPFLRHRLPQSVSAVRFATSKTLSSFFKSNDQTQLQKTNSSIDGGGGGAESTTTTTFTSNFDTDSDNSSSSRWVESPDYRKWKDSEAEIFRDIEPIVSLTKHILHSDRYSDGEPLSDEDEKAVVEKLLAYHPHSEDKIGSGLDYIMVDRHPEFHHSRCLFVVRKDGGWIDFSYHKCLRAYIRAKYSSYGERFVREHFKRGMVNSSSM